jgi:hypothetical protein
MARQLILVCKYVFVCICRGLGDRKSTHFLLRDTLHFLPSTYYAAIVANFFMRLGWALVVSPEQPFMRQHYLLLLGAVEITRRSLWGVLRVEWECIKNRTTSPATAAAAAAAGQSEKESHGASATDLAATRKSIVSRHRAEINTSNVCRHGRAQRTLRVRPPKDRGGRGFS